MYPLILIRWEGSLKVAELTTCTMWNGRLGHMSQSRLERLSALGYILKLNHAKSDFCEHYKYGKHTRILHSLNYETVRNPLELIHSDICGPMPERSLGGSRYFITFVDDCTRKVWAYSLRSKDEALTVFSRWLAEVEN